MPTPQENRDKLTALFDDTARIVTGEWETIDDPTPRSCDTVEGGEGVQYSRLRTVVTPTESQQLEHLADLVAALWETHGYETSRSEDPLLGLEVNGTNEQRSVLQFTISEDAASLHGGSNCTPGNFEKIMEQLRDEAKLSE